MVLWVQLAHACSCFFTGSFCETVGFLQNIPEEKFNVVQVKVEEKHSEGIRVVVLASFYGKAEHGTEFFIKNGNGAECSISTIDFQVGEQYIFVLEFPTAQLQLLSSCGTYFLLIENDKVKGNIAPGVKEVDLSKFANLPNCGDLRKPDEPYFTVLPTLLTYDESLVAFPSFWDNATDVSVRIFDIRGRLVMEKQERNFSGFEPLQIETTGWAAGMYILQIDYWGKRQTMKIVKAS